MKRELIKLYTLWTGLFFMLSSFIYGLQSNEKWFERAALGLILLALYGIMEHLNKLTK